MNRIIKFRAWDKEEKKLFSWSFTQDGLCPQDFFNNANYELMQFTGRLDKNGTEIYEGDVVKTAETDVNYTWLIEWNSQQCCFQGKGYFNGTLVRMRMPGIAKGIVVGNKKCKNSDLVNHKQ